MTKLLLSAELAEKVLRRVARWLADKWTELAYELNLRKEDVREIKADYPGSVVEQGFEMLCRWRERQGNAASAADLIEALREAELNDVADKLMEKLTGM